MPRDIAPRAVRRKTGTPASTRRLRPIPTRCRPTVTCPAHPTDFHHCSRGSHSRSRSRCAGHRLKPQAPTGYARAGRWRSHPTDRPSMSRPARRPRRLRAKSWRMTMRSRSYAAPHSTAARCNTSCRESGCSPSNTTQSGIDRSESATNSRGADRSHESPRARQHDRIGEQNESGPADWRVPRVERLDPEDRRRFRDDHDRHAGQGTCAHVTRIRNEHPLSAGVPTPLPRINTLCVLPRPPGISSVLKRKRGPSGSRGSSEVRRWTEAEQKVCLVEKSECREPFRFGGGANAREVHVRRDVLLAGLTEPRGRLVRRLRPFTLVPRECRQRAGRSASPSTARAPRDRSR